MASLGLGLGLPFRRAAAAAPAHPLLTLNPRFLYAGGGSALSVFAQNSDGTTPDTADGQVTGYVQDLTTNAKNATQTVTNNKALYYENGGAKGFRGGYVSGQRRWLEVPLTFTNDIDIIIVEKRGISSGFNVPIYFKQGSLRLMAGYDATTITMFQDNVGSTTDSATRTSTPVIARLSTYLDTVPKVIFRQYALDGTLVASAPVQNLAVNGNGTLYFCDPEYDRSSTDDFYFAIGFTDRSLDSTDFAAVVANISANYGSLT